MLEPRIQQHFFESADLLYQVAETLSAPIAESSQAIVGCLTAGGKVLVQGSGAGSVLARTMNSALLHRFERARPALASVWIEQGCLPLYPQESEPASASVAEIPTLQALGQAGDWLILFSLSANDPAVELAIAEAHAKDMGVILIGAGLATPWHAMLAETDIWIAIPHERAIRALPVQCLVMQALCDAIDVQLLGDAESD